MKTTPRLAHTIDEVITQLETIIHEAESNKDRAGYFAALYHKVTVKVKEGIEDGIFENGPRLAELDVLFANRYLYALQEWHKDPNSPDLSDSWRTTFRNFNKSSRLVLQHLLLGMNAHINYDLGIAVVEAARQGYNMDELRRDYNAINTILAALSYDVINKLNIISPLLSVLGFTGTKSNSMLVQFSLGTARDGSWCFATDLSEKQGDDYILFINRRDKEIKALGELLVKSSGFMKIGLFFIYLFEWKKVDRIVNMLHTHQQRSMSELATR